MRLWEEVQEVLHGEGNILLTDVEKVGDKNE